MTRDPHPPSPADTGDALRSRERLAEIRELGLTSPDLDPVLAELCREAAHALSLPVGLVSIVLDGAQHFAAQHGLSGWMKETRGTPIDWSFCVHAVRSGEDFVVTDATRDPAVRDSPLVHNEGVRCYAGVPLRTSRGHIVGTLCALGEETRPFSGGDLAILRGLAGRVVAHIESRRRAAG